MSAEEVYQEIERVSAQRDRYKRELDAARDEMNRFLEVRQQLDEAFVNDVSSRAFEKFFTAPLKKATSYWTVFGGLLLAAGSVIAISNWFSDLAEGVATQVVEDDVLKAVDRRVNDEIKPAGAENSN